MRAGWYESDSSGAHIQLRHPDRPGRKITVPVHGGRALDIKVVRSIAAQAGLSPNEFERLL